MATAIENWQSHRIKGYQPLHESTVRGRLAQMLGLLLLLSTGFFWWVAFGELPRGIERPDVPPILFAAYAFCLFGLLGIYLLVIGVRDVGRDRVVANLKEIHPDEPWRWDYPWHPSRSRDISLRLALSSVVGLVLAIGIVGPIAYTVLTGNSPVFAKFGVGFFVIVLSLSASTVIYRLWTRVVHGQGEILYQDFPLRLGEPIELQLVPGNLLDDVEYLCFTLRCVQETCLHERTGNFAPPHRPTHKVTKIGLQRYFEEQVVAVPSGSGRIAVEFQLPNSEQLRTRLSSVDGNHWELIVTGERRGVDFYQRFLLPIYEP